MSSLLRIRVGTWLVDGLVAALFALSGALKLGDPARFATDIGHYRLVSAPVAAAMAVYLPWLEIVLAVALLTPRWRCPSRGVAAMLLFIFSAALASAAWRGIDLRCGCFGEATATGVAGALARNAVLLALLFAGWRFTREPAPRSD